MLMTSALSWMPSNKNPKNEYKNTMKYWISLFYEDKYRMQKNEEIFWPSLGSKLGKCVWSKFMLTLKKQLLQLLKLKEYWENLGKFCMNP